MSRWAALISCASVLAACGETPLDVITAIPGSGGNAGLDGGSGSLGDAPLEAGAPCEALPMPIAGRYRVQQATSLRCLRAGEPTVLMGNPGYRVALDESCSSDPAGVWDLIVAGPQRYQFQNVGVDMNLDIQFAATSNGTPAVLYAPTMLRNQQFIFRSLGSSRFELAAAHAFAQCLAERVPQPEIWPCNPNDTTMIWQLIPERCL
jgi:hypothetical protein